VEKVEGHIKTGREGLELRQRMRKHKTGYLMLAPWLLLFLAFTVIPVIVNLLLSFTYFNGLSLPKLVWFENFRKLFIGDDLFYTALRNSLMIAVFTGPVAYIMCLIFAWFINELPPVPRSVLTLIFYMPVLAGNMFMIWALIFSGDVYGFLNSWLIGHGFIQEQILWLVNKDYTMPIIIVVQLWMSLGTGFLAFIAGLQGVDPVLYESGAIDGIKNRFQELWFITLPMMRPVLVLGAVLQITASLGSSQVAIALFGYTGGTDYAGYTLQSFMIDYGSTRMEIGYVAAIATILSFFMISLNKIIQRSLRKIGG